MTRKTQLIAPGIPGQVRRFIGKAAASIRDRITALRPFGIPGAWLGNLKSAMFFSDQDRAFAVVSEDRTFAVASEDRAFAVASEDRAFAINEE